MFRHYERGAHSSIQPENELRGSRSRYPSKFPHHSELCLVIISNHLGSVAPNTWPPRIPLVSTLADLPTRKLVYTILNAT